MRSTFILVALRALRQRTSGGKLHRYAARSVAALLLLVSAIANAQPVLVTTTLPSAGQGTAYASHLIVASASPLSSASATGLPAGLTAVHNGSGLLTITGTPTQAGTFALNIAATDSAAGNLNTTVSLQVATNTATALAAGSDHSCAVVSGGVQCWGNNRYGQLGNGITAWSTAPELVAGLTSGVTAVAAGQNHSCAVVNGGLQCWGFNERGQLGNGSSTNSIAPVQVTGLTSGVTAVATGESHSCAVVNGGVRCWGFNDRGQLGNGSSTNSTTPVQVVGLTSGVTALAAGGGHSCAVVNGGVRCWGFNDRGQLGNGSSTNSTTPVQVVGLTSGVTALAAGRGHSCAVVSGGVRCWGFNDRGQLGNGSSTNSTTPVQVVGLTSGVTAVAAGYNHSCAVVNGGVRCWGSNRYGQLGNDTNTDTIVPTSTPVQVTGLTSGVSALATGDSYSCAVVNGGVQCWGDNLNGLLGNGSTMDSNTPVQVTGVSSGVTALAAGSDHSCAVVSGGVQCWGFNRYGQLGNGRTTNSDVPVQVTGLTSGVTAVATGSAEFSPSCAVVNGGVRCWGFNDRGQLGNGSSTNSTTPVQVVGLTSGVTAVSMGNDHSCAVVNGGVRCWGDNSYGQLGDGTTAKSTTPVQVTGLTSGVTAVAAGYNHSCAVVNGGVRCWGLNDSGQLGNGTTTDTYVPTSTPVQVTGLTFGVTALAAGGGHSCAVVNGGVRCWGSNPLGQLGNGTTTNSTTPVQVTGLTSGVTAVEVGHHHSCAVVNGGAQCWGSNFSGQLGNGRLGFNDSTTPVQVTGLISRVTAVAAGFQHSCAVVNGAPVCWGSNRSGQLGYEPTGRTPTPRLASLLVPLAPPGAPTNVNATRAPSAGAVTVMFTVPASNGGAAITSYTASCSASGQATRTATGTASPLTVTGLTNGIAYTCTVTATNSGGTGSASALSSAVTPQAPTAPLPAIPSDIFGERRSTLTWVNTNGAVTFWRNNGSAFVDTGVNIGPFPGWSLLSAEGDFDGDGKSDLLWLRTDGAISIWLMNGTTVKSQSQAGPYAGWSLFSANSDFNGDGKTDLIWQRTDGALSLWAMNGGIQLEERTHGPFSGWSLLSSNNDFDGDGKSDLLWKKNTGGVSLWLMNGVSVKQVSPEYGPYPGWTVISGSSDYNGDGRTDLTWEKSDNSVSVWQMDGVTSTAQSAQFGPFTGWRLMPGKRDFDSDGKSDLLWQRTDGAASVWLMNGVASPPNASISSALTPSGTGWQLLSTLTDFNGDGKTDLVWQTPAGQVAVGLANGVVMPAQSQFGPFSGWSHFTATATTTTPAVSQTPASESIIVQPNWKLVTQDAQGNHNTESILELAGISDDGNKVAFYTWSQNTFGTGAPPPAWGYVYVRDMSAANTVVAVRTPSGAPLSVYQPSAWISGNGNYVVFQQSLKRFSSSAQSSQGIWRSEVGKPGYDMVSIKGLEFGFEMNGTLKLGETILGSFDKPVPDRDGNSIVFLGEKILNDSRAPYNQRNEIAYFNAVLRLDKGAQPVGNQDYALNHSLVDSTLDVDPGGTIVILGEYKNSLTRYVLWDMLERAGLASPFAGVIQKDANASFRVCGTSYGASKLLVQVGTSQPMTLSDMPGSLTTAKFGSSKLLLYDRATDTYQLASAAERKSAGSGARCDYPFGGGLQRQLSSDGNIVIWKDSLGFYVRNLARQKTVLINIPGTVGRFILSGDGRYIVYSGDTSPSGLSYLNSRGSKIYQIFQIGPIDTDAGRTFTSADYWRVHLQ
jgi:alpha-tubulin suppressor-like RCC1 family protein